MAAHNMIPANAKETDYGFNRNSFHSHLKLNELLLAMEELDGVIEDNQNLGVKFWDHLITASKLLGHEPSTRRYVHIKSLTT